MKRPQCLILSTLTLRASIDTMFTDLADALRRQGVYARIHNDTPQAPNPDLVRGLIGDLRDYAGPRILIDLNCKSEFSIASDNGDPASIHDAWGIPKLTIFESNPIYHLGYLAKAPGNFACTVIDAQHLDALDAFDIKTRTRGFLPHAGPPPLENIQPWRDRPIDVLFIGNIKREPPVEEWVSALFCNAEIKPAVRRVIEQRWEERSDLPSRLRQALADLGLALDARRNLALASEIDRYVNNVKRLEMLSSISSGRVVVCGEIGAELPNSDCVTATGPATFSVALQYMDNAKILLNTMPFRTGAHERVFYGLGRGAYILSDASALLETPAANDAGISFLPASVAEFDGALAGILSMDRRDAVAAGRAWYADRHTWDHRARQLIELMTPLF